jgi:hypothetical protein
MSVRVEHDILANDKFKDSLGKNFASAISSISTTFSSYYSGHPKKLLTISEAKKYLHDHGSTADQFVSRLENDLFVRVINASGYAIRKDGEYSSLQDILDIFGIIKSDLDLVDEAELADSLGMCLDRLHDLKIMPEIDLSIEAYMHGVEKMMSNSLDMMNRQLIELKQQSADRFSEIVKLKNERDALLATLEAMREKKLQAIALAKSMVSTLTE